MLEELINKISSFLKIENEDICFNKLMEYILFQEDIQIKYVTTRRKYQKHLRVTYLIIQIDNKFDRISTFEFKYDIRKSLKEQEEKTIKYLYKLFVLNDKTIHNNCIKY